MQPLKKISSGAVQLQPVAEYKLDQARALRSTMTPAENVLWQTVRGKKCGNLKFRRQQVLDGFIVDFFCAEYNLAVEVDGAVHDTKEQQQIDEHRRNVFKARGVREIRFRNEEILNDVEQVRIRIIEECKKWGSCFRE